VESDIIGLEYLKCIVSADVEESGSIIVTC